MITYHFRKSVQQKLQRCLILLFFLFRQFVQDFFDVIGDIMGMFRSFQNEIILIPYRIEDNVPFMEKRIPKRIIPDLGSFYIMIIYMYHVSCKYVPIDIHHSHIRYKPHIVVPIEYLIYKEEIESDRICFEIEKRNERL